MMDEPIPVLAGDVVMGAVVLQRNPVWRRYMSVTLSWSITSAQDPALQKVRYLALESCALMLSRKVAGLWGSQWWVPVPTPADSMPELVCVVFLILMAGGGPSWSQEAVVQGGKFSL